MASQTTNYQCPSCTGPLHFDSESGQMKCDYCGSIYSVEEIDALYGAKNKAAEQAAEKAAEASDGWDYSGMTDDWGADAASLNAYNCTSCGAELICEATTAATTCPYCGNNTVIPGKFAGSLKPDFIIPFAKTKEDAMRSMRGYYKGKKLLPKAFSDENQIEKIQGLYVPFWLFDGEADADAEYAGEIVRTYRTSNEEVTETSHYRLYRRGQFAFDKIPVDASQRMDDALMDSIEPFDYQGLKEFSLSYLPGYLADKYDCSAAESAERADKRAESSVAGALYRSVTGFTGVREIRKSISLRRGKVHYALLPVWILNTAWQGKQYTFAMNGQTGQFTGDLPMDKKRYWTWHLIYGAIFAAVVYFIKWLLTAL